MNLAQNSTIWVGLWSDRNFVRQREVAGKDDPLIGEVNNDLASLRARQIAHLKNSPSWLAPIVSELYRHIYKGFHLVHRLISWSLDYLDAKLAELAEL